MTTATDDTENGASYYKPTAAERFWRWLGFRYHLGEEPDGTDGLPGWMRTDSTLHFSWGDRLRLLVTGRLKTSTICYFDTPAPDIVKTRLDWQIEAPTGARAR